jgi:hypothetical protein
MRKTAIAGTLLVLIGSYAYPQTIRPFKDVVFSQVAAGGGYETWLTLTNRGVVAYTGTLSLYHSDGTEWNAAVDGTTITGGKLSFSMGAGSTKTTKITARTVTESGYAVVAGDSPHQNNFLEGNLTYFVKSGNNITDAVGIMPSTEFFLTSVPFEDFQSLALALVNRGTGTALVTLDLYSSNNTKAATQNIQIAPGTQFVRFAYQTSFEFMNAGVTRGRLDISSTAMLAGTALTFIQNQFSSLPLNPSGRAYSFSSAFGRQTNGGTLNLWADGNYFKGTMVVSQMLENKLDPPFVIQVFGQVYDGLLRLQFFSPTTSYGNPPTNGYTVSNSAFSFDLQTVTNIYTTLMLEDNSTQKGTLTMTRLN